MERIPSHAAGKDDREGDEPDSAEGPLSRDWLSGFNFIHLEVACHAETDLFLPHFTGSTFRGVFGRTLKDLACVARRERCPECPLLSRCVYTNVFEVYPRGDLPIYTKVSRPPRPFILRGLGVIH